MVSAQAAEEEKENQEREVNPDLKELLEWAEKNALENLKFRIQNADTLAKDATTTLTAILAGIGGTLAYVVKVLEHGPLTSMAIGIAAIAVWLAIAGGVLVCNCILSIDLSAPTNEPKNIFQKQYSLAALKEVELRNIQTRIEQTRDRNHRVAAWLDRSRLMALASPIVFVISAWVSAAL